MRLRFWEIAHHIALDICNTQWFVGRRKKNFSANPLAIAEREDGGATFGGGEWVVIHIVLGFGYLRVLLHHSRHSISAPAQIASCGVALGCDASHSSISCRNVIVMLI